MKSSTKRTFYRDEKRGKIAGICAGLANYFGWEVWVVRIVAVTGLILMSKFTLVAYIIAWIATDKAPKSVANQPTMVKEAVSTERTADGRTIEVKTRVWEAGEPPKQAIGDIKLQFDRMEQGLRSMERYVTSSEFKVRQEFNKLG